MTTPRLHRSADRCYTLVEPFNIGAFRQYLEERGARYQRPYQGALYSHRWQLDTPAGRTVVTYFPSGRIVALGPSVALLDELVECEVTT